MNSKLSELGFTYRGGRWYSKDNHFIFSSQNNIPDILWELIVKKEGAMVFKIEDEQTLLTILNAVGYEL